ncbi:hypothetical protein MUP35_01265 [Patescibacteria group bacterium]|nr:hypothetical protein [Patescibacteria group bacterium]
MSLKETDLGHVSIDRSSRSIAKAVRRKKAEKDFDGAKIIWENDQNKPNRIRRRIEDYFKKIDIVVGEYHSEELQEELKEIKGMSLEKAKEEIKKYNKIIIPKEGEKELNFDNLEDVSNYIIYGQKGKERINFFNLLSKVHPKSMFYLFSVDGKGKTNLEKTISKRK